MTSRFPVNLLRPSPGWPGDCKIYKFCSFLLPLCLIDLQTAIGCVFYAAGTASLGTIQSNTYLLLNLEGNGQTLGESPLKSIARQNESNARLCFASHDGTVMPQPIRLDGANVSLKPEGPSSSSEPYCKACEDAP